MCRSACLDCGAALAQNPRGARRLRCPDCAKRANLERARARERLKSAGKN
jgi:DNA-directed RNA polymerase subunit RPC12/RpoP